MLASTRHLVHASPRSMRRGSARAVVAVGTAWSTVRVRLHASAFGPCRTTTLIDPGQRGERAP